MIKYEADWLGLFFACRWKGTVFHKAMIWAVPNAVAAILLFIFARQDQVEGNYLSMVQVNILWSGFTSVLGFVMVFRNNQAYTRFWEGATLIAQVRGEWFNAVSTLFAFCNHTRDVDKVEAADNFQQTLIRFTSMLYCAALQQVCDLKDDTFEILDTQGICEESLEFLQKSADRVEIMMQWIQRLIVDSKASGAISIDPPLLTRAFQEFGSGMVHLNNVRKIKEIPFPFPYSQMIVMMLIVHWVMTPVIASQVLHSWLIAGVGSFFVTGSFWCLFYIAIEIDQPFGEDWNDLPLRELQIDFNKSLVSLLHPLAQKAPSFRLPEGCGRQPSLSKVNSHDIRCTHRSARRHLARIHSAVRGYRARLGRHRSATEPVPENAPKMEEGPKTNATSKDKDCPVLPRVARAALQAGGAKAVSETLPEHSSTAMGRVMGPAGSSGELGGAAPPPPGRKDGEGKHGDVTSPLPSGRAGGSGGRGERPGAPWEVSPPPAGRPAGEGEGGEATSPPRGRADGRGERGEVLRMGGLDEDGGAEPPPLRPLAGQIGAAGMKAFRGTIGCSGTGAGASNAGTGESGGTAEVRQRHQGSLTNWWPRSNSPAALSAESEAGPLTV